MAGKAKKNANPRRQPAEDKIDPTLPYVDIEVRGQKLKMCFTFRAMALGERNLRAQGVNVNLLRSMGDPSMDGITTLFAASLHAYQPEMTYEQIAALVDHDTLFAIDAALAAAWVLAMPAGSLGGKKANPPGPQA